MRKRIAQAAAVTLLSIALAATTVSAAGSPRVDCVTDGVTALTGPVPKDALIVTFTWYDSPGAVGAIVGSESWTGGKKRYPTPPSALSVRVYFFGVNDSWVDADCQA